MTNEEAVAALADWLPRVSAPVMDSGTAAAMPRNSRRDGWGIALIWYLHGVGKAGEVVASDHVGRYVEPRSVERSGAGQRSAASARDAGVLPGGAGNPGGVGQLVTRKVASPRPVALVISNDVRRIEQTLGVETGCVNTFDMEQRQSRPPDGEKMLKMLV